MTALLRITPIYQKVFWDMDKFKGFLDLQTKTLRPPLPKQMQFGYMLRFYNQKLNILDLKAFFEYFNMDRQPQTDVDVLLCDVFKECKGSRYDFKSGLLYVYGSEEVVEELKSVLIERGMVDSE